jgi:endonuclease IV
MDAIEGFLALQSEHTLQSAEVHLERSLYQAACWPWEEHLAFKIRTYLRPEVSKLGVHLPFIDLNPIAANRQIACSSRQILEESIRFAAMGESDYVVFHARGGRQTSNEELYLWSQVVGNLAEVAEENGVLFCLENADDLREPDKICRIIHDYPRVKLCLDIGHLYERIYPSSPLLHKILILNDHFAPVPFLLKSGLPAANGWPFIFAYLKKRVALLHIHNHDGKLAHQPLLKGKIDLCPLRGIASELDNIPVILEADYRNMNLETVRADLYWLGDLQ